MKELIADAELVKVRERLRRGQADLHHAGETERPPPPPDHLLEAHARRAIDRVIRRAVVLACVEAAEDARMIDAPRDRPLELEPRPADLTTPEVDGAASRRTAREELHRHQALHAVDERFRTEDPIAAHDRSPSQYSCRH